MVFAAWPHGLGMPLTSTIRKPGWSTISLKARYWSMCVPLRSWKFLARQHSLRHFQHLFVVLQQQRLRHGNAALARRARFHPGNPGLQVGQTVNVDAAPFIDTHPASVGDIRDAV